MTDQNQKPAAGQFPPLEIRNDLQTEYVNLVRIAHSPSEMVLDFAQLLPGNTTAKVQSRIVMSPLGAKLFFRALDENLKRFESTYGEIAIPGGGSLAEQLFHPPDEPHKPE